MQTVNPATGASAHTDPAPDAMAGHDNADGNITLATEAVSQLNAYPWLQSVLGCALLLALAWLGHHLLHRYVLRIVALFTRRLPAAWNAALVNNQAFERLAPLAPVFIIYHGIALIPHLPAALADFVQRLMVATLVILCARVIGTLLNVGHDLYNQHSISAGRPIKGYVQLLKLIVYLLAGILVIAALANQSPWFFISGLGAMTAILMLIFRDTLLSLVAGMQLVNNDLIRVGDWIEMPQLNADGDVIDISLYVVRVRNWDRTITVIPAHKFLEHSFKNWRGMFESGGRRISRTVWLDMSSVRFLTAEEIERFRRFVLLREYIDGKERELAEWNAANVPADGSDIRANMRYLTNIGTFRAYVTQYLKRHPQIHQDQLMLIRQMEPGPQGVGIQIYTFTRDTRWVYYEGIQSDIFDHILSIVPEFGLRVFQSPSGHDVTEIGAALQIGRDHPAAGS